MSCVTFPYYYHGVLYSLHTYTPYHGMNMHAKCGIASAVCRPRIGTTYVASPIIHAKVLH